MDLREVGRGDAEEALATIALLRHDTAAVQSLWMHALTATGNHRGILQVLHSEAARCAVACGYRRHRKVWRRRTRSVAEVLLQHAPTCSTMVNVTLKAYLRARGHMRGPREQGSAMRDPSLLASLRSRLIHLIGPPVSHPFLASSNVDLSSVQDADVGLPHHAFFLRTEKAAPRPCSTRRVSLYPRIPNPAAKPLRCDLFLDVGKGFWKPPTAADARGPTQAQFDHHRAGLFACGV